MRIRSTVERKEFFELLSSASSNAVDVARLGKLFERYPRDGEELIGRIKEHEHTGDSLTHEIVDQLNKTFVTPFDRDDAYRLAAAIDDVCDFVDETADPARLLGRLGRAPDARALADVVAARLGEDLHRRGDRRRHLRRRLADHADDRTAVVTLVAAAFYRPIQAIF